MTEYLYPLATVVLDFFCVLFCIRLTASRRGPVWLIPMAMSLALLAGSTVCLIATASDIAGELLSTVASYAAMFLLGLSVIWLVTIISFNQRTKPDRIVAEAVAKAEKEATATIAAAHEKAETEIRPSEEALKAAADAIFNAVTGGGR